MSIEKVYQFVTSGALSIDAEGRVWRNLIKVGGDRGPKLIKTRRRAEIRTPNQYLMVQVWENAKCYSCGAHRLVYKHFKKHIPCGRIIHHLDGKKDNNTLSNLQVMSFSEHNKHHKRVPWNKGKTKNDPKLLAWHNRCVESRRRGGDAYATSGR